MIVKKAIPGTNAFRDIKTLYHAVFPADERLPFWWILCLSLLKTSPDMLAFYEDEIFCGFSFTIFTGQYLYINYLSVDPSLRSKGYGTKILTFLRNKFSAAMICEVKVPDPENRTYPQDEKRVAFWKRNGFDFFDGKHTITNPHGIKYYICSTASEYSPEAYWAVVEHLSFNPITQLRILKRRLFK